MPLNKKKKIAITACVAISASVIAAIIIYKKYNKSTQINVDNNDDNTVDKEEDFADDIKSNNNQLLQPAKDKAPDLPRLDALNSNSNDLRSTVSAHPINNVNVSFINTHQILELLAIGTDITENHYVIIDVRDNSSSYNDYMGGHIAGSVNISDQIFYDSIPDILIKYNNKKIIILQCMYGAARSVECSEYYAKSITEILLNYNSATKQSYYYKYILKTSSHDKRKSVMKTIKFNDNTWMNKNVEKIKIKINFTSSSFDGINPNQIIDNLSKQKIHVIYGGFFEFINNSKAINPVNTNIIHDFDNKCWEELKVADKKTLYHKYEHFSTVEQEPLRKVFAMKQIV